MTQNQESNNRDIHMGSGNYNERIEGDYVQNNVVYGKNYSIEYLERKITFLEEKRKKLFNANNYPKNEKYDNLAEKAALFTDHRFHLASEILQETKHHLGHVSTDLTHTEKVIKESIAFYREIKHGLIKSPDEWEGKTENLLKEEGGNIIKEMNLFADSVMKAIDTELIVSTQKIEKLTLLD